MRPKFILIRVGPRKYRDFSEKSSGSKDPYASELLEDVEGTLGYLKRKGFMASKEGQKEHLCDDIDGLNGHRSLMDWERYNQILNRGQLQMSSSDVDYSEKVEKKIKKKLLKNIQQLNNSNNKINLDIGNKMDSGEIALTDTFKLNSNIKKKYVCVWGTRVNTFEFSGKSWGKWGS
jgi:hypothetical protein